MGYNSGIIGSTVSKTTMSRHNKKKRPPQLPHVKTMRMKDNHTWNAPNGYKIVVADRGAVSFNVPASWILAKMEPNLELNDKTPPDDNARLSMSFWQTRPGINWTELPLVPLLLQSAADTKMEILEQSAIKTSPRQDIEIVWLQKKFLDPVEKRDAYTRIALARGFDVHVLLTFDVWVDDLKKFKHVWDEALRSLQLGRHIEDPSKGPILH
jgi:hypothetical protein